MEKLTFYKIQHKTTGLYSTGGTCPCWNKTGKTWNQIGHVKSHITSLRFYKTEYIGVAQIVKFEVITTEAEFTDIL